MIYLQLFIQFMKIGVMSFGGGYVAIPLIQNQIVNTNQWITMKEFSDLITIAEMTPGPIAINSATFVGYKVGGYLGAVLASIGVIFPSLFIVSILFLIYNKYKDISMMSGILGCMRAVVVVLIADAAFSFFNLMAFEGRFADISSIDKFSLTTFILALIALRKFKLSPILVMLACGLARLFTLMI